MAPELLGSKRAAWVGPGAGPAAKGTYIQGLGSGTAQDYLSFKILINLFI